jgi:hypothetical protein
MNRILLLCTITLGVAHTSHAMDRFCKHSTDQIVKDPIAQAAVKAAAAAEEAANREIYKLALTACEEYAKEKEKAYPKVYSALSALNLIEPKTASSSTPKSDLTIWERRTGLTAPERPPTKSEIADQRIKETLQEIDDAFEHMALSTPQRQTPTSSTSPETPETDCAIS